MVFAPTTDERMTLAPIEMSSSPAPSRNDDPDREQDDLGGVEPHVGEVARVEEDVVRGDHAEEQDQTEVDERDPERGLLEEALQPRAVADPVVLNGAGGGDGRRCRH